MPFRLSLMLYPRASIHAFIGILPVIEITLPTQFVDTAPSFMEVTFTVGALLSRIGSNKNSQPAEILTKNK
ncbi:hypothetical protein CLV59_108108 [Chitinophaga dinghuensis]|uniref:Uncharacterized protein n=1 Tax=Chitinophaga dinghuensis TaxID=1539050 RepID=A0A327VR81_9BACT|nr:hypothetical protein CLV59_108108 [Chitinophaga dinghuensis]